MEEQQQLDDPSEPKPPIVSYKLSRRNIAFVKIAYKIGNFICITPWYDFDNGKFVHPVINLVYSVLLGAILILVLFRTVQEREFLDEQMVQKFLLTSSDMISIILTEYSVIAATFLHKDKWQTLLEMFATIDDKLENNHNVQFRVANTFYVQLLLGHVFFVGCYAYKAYVWSNIVGFRYFSTNFGTMVIPMYYCFFSAMLLSNVVLALRCRYRDLNALLHRKATLHQYEEEKFLEDLIVIRRYYRHLGDTVEVFNKIFGWVIILIVLHSIVEILNCVNLILRSFVDPTFSWDVFSSCLWVCSLSMGGAMYIVLCCDSASSEGEKITRLSYKLEENFDHLSRCRVELVRLADFAKTYTPKFLAANFFVIERSTILGIISIATTYLIVVIQFNTTILKTRENGTSIMVRVEENGLKTHIYILQMHMIWPGDTSRPVRFGDFLFVVCLYWPLFLYYGTAYVHLYYSYVGSSVELIDDVVVILEVFFCIYTLVMFYWRFNEILPFVRDLTCFDKFGKPKHLDKIIQKQNRNMKILYAYTLFGGIIYSIYTYYTNRQCSEKNLREGTSNVCLFFAPVLIPANILLIPFIRDSTFVIQTFIFVCCLLSAIAGTYLMACVTELLTVRVTQLRAMIKEIAEIPTPSEKEEKFLYCVQYHVDIVRLVERSFLCFSELNAVHFLLSSLIIAILNYKVIKIFSVKDIIHLNGWLCSIAILCYSGQQLIDESSLLANEVYALAWYDMDRRLQHHIKFVIQNMQKPLRNQAGIFYAYSNEFMLAIAQASYTYLTVMNQFLNFSN